MDSVSAESEQDGLPGLGIFLDASGRASFVWTAVYALMTTAGPKCATMVACLGSIAISATLLSAENALLSRQAGCHMSCTSSKVQSASGYALLVLLLARGPSLSIRGSVPTKYR